MSLSRREALSTLLLLAACGPSPHSPAPHHRTSPPATADELLPGDLDWVVRIDVARLRRSVGEDAWTKLTGGSNDLGVGRADDERGVFVRALAEHATALWFGFPSVDRDTFADSVIVASGDLDLPTLVTPSGGAWEKTEITLAGSAVRQRSPLDRSGPALGVLLPGRGIVLATPALVDGVARVIRDGPDQTRLDPPADGVAGLAGRFRKGELLRSKRLPKLAASLSDLVFVRAVLDVDPGLVRVDVVLSFASAQGAAEGMAALDRLRVALAAEAKGTASELAKASALERTSDFDVIVRVRAPGDLARGWLGG